MSAHSGRTWAWPALLFVAACGLVLRLLSLVVPGGPMASPVDYDDGVYFSASALLFRGVLPYRDFIFVHPPGVLYFFGLTSWLGDAAHGFTAARMLAVLVGAANIVLAGAIVMRAAGPFGGLAAAALYATYPAAVVAERSPYLEPVLNLACLASAFLWLRPAESSGRRSETAGLLCGAACSVKVLGGIWLVAAIASAPRDRFRPYTLRFIAGAVICGVALVAPLALFDLTAFVEQTLMFHSRRPADGVVRVVPRLRELLDGDHLAATVLAIAALGSMLVSAVSGKTVPREHRYFAVAWILTVLAFLASASYWTHYNSHLAASECVLAGFGAAALAQWRAARPRLPAVLLTAAIAAVHLPSLRAIVHRSLARSPEVVALGDAIRRTVPLEQCVFSFDPGWAVAGGRLPPFADRAPVIVDSYGAMLLAALEEGARFANADAAFQNERSQTDIRARLQACRFAVFGWRGRWQLNARSRAWVDAHYICDTPGTAGLPLCERMDGAAAGLALSPWGAVVFGEGWYDEETAPPSFWRWMAQRSVTVLPAATGPARLGLVMHVPLAELAGLPTITVALDGRVIDRFTPGTSEVSLVYEVAASPGRRSLVLSTTTTFHPAAAGRSSDARALGIRLDRLTWRAAGGGATSSSPSPQSSTPSR